MILRIATLVENAPMEDKSRPPRVFRCGDRKKFAYYLHEDGAIQCMSCLGYASTMLCSDSGGS